VSTFPRHSDQTATRPAPQISEERRQTVETARRSWIRKLIDLSRRNNLLYFRPLKTGTLELTSASSERLRDLLVGESVSAAKLLPNLEDDLLAKMLRDISRRARRSPLMQKQTYARSSRCTIASMKPRRRQAEGLLQGSDAEAVAPFTRPRAAQILNFRR
jgi:hypothetical protein